MKSTPGLQNTGQIKTVAQQGFAAPQVWSLTWALWGRGREGGLQSSQQLVLCKKSNPVCLFSSVLRWRTDDESSEPNTGITLKDKNRLL